MNDLVLLKPLTYEFVGTVWKLMTFETEYLKFLFFSEKHTFCCEQCQGVQPSSVPSPFALEHKQRQEV